MKPAQYLLAFAVGLIIAHHLDADRRDTALTLRAAHAAEETPPETLAIQIRKQGYACDKPVSVDRDAERSKPHEAVWILRCANAS
jgi:hypothetical protein